MNTITADWLKSAKMDLILIEQIIDREDLTPLIAFHSQQCIEKAFKAIIEEYTDKHLKLHKLMVLYEHIKNIITFDFNEDKKDLLDTLDNLYIDSRYPGDLGLLPNGNPTIEDSKKFYKIANNIYNDIKKFLKKGTLNSE
ncbi:HEPN domain-containing protein [Candidatus Magnetomoraceae bacterium gMMP-15]